MSWKGFKDIQATIEIDLTKTEKEIWQRLNKDAKRYVKKSEKYNLEFVESNNWEDFYPFYRKVIIRGGITAKLLEELKLKKDYKLFLIKKEQKIIGGMVLDVGDEEKVDLPIIVSDPDFNYTASGYFGYWNSILWAKKEGYKILNLGGYQLNAKGKLKKINKFKEKWGGEIKKYYVYSKNPFYILGRKIIRNFYFIKKIRDDFKVWRNKKKL